MAMNKKEKQLVEALKQQLAFKRTVNVEKDLAPPSTEMVGFNIVNGYSFNMSSQIVSKSCSSCLSHSYGNWNDTKSRQPIEQFSSKLRALKALRYALEEDVAKQLRQVDKQIERELLEIEELTIDKGENK